MANNIKFYNAPSLLQNLFEGEVELLPSVNELFELELAYLEYNSLNENNFLNRTAYFKSRNNQYSKHYLMFNTFPDALNEERSAATKNYFENGKFSTGYATHGLFPYRGKFHPQLIKALINIIGIKEGETILDPMCGSGTTNIEASLMGIDSIAVDLSPFCQFMTKVKYNSLKIDTELLKEIPNKVNKFFDYFSSGNISEKFKKIDNPEKLKIYELTLLAYLDALGYSKRVVKATHLQLFEKVLKRYIETVTNFKMISSKYIDHFGIVEVLTNTSAKKIPLKNKSVNGVITSSPYSFGIDYVKNDNVQLKFFGYYVKDIRRKMIRFIDKNKKVRLLNYFRDIRKFYTTLISLIIYFSISNNEEVYYA